MNLNVGILTGVCPVHEHKCHEIIIYTAGCGFFHADGFCFPFYPGAIMVVPPETPHYSVSDGDYERIYINGEFNWAFNLAQAAVMYDNKENEGIFLAKMIYRNRYKSTEYVISLLNAFISHIIQNIETDDKMDIAIKNIISELTARFYDCSLNVGQILNESGYAEDYIRAQFKKATGKTPVRFLTDTRISHACLLIEMYKSSLTLSEISEKCGFTDYVYFSRRFKEITGASPRKYLRSGC